MRLINSDQVNLKAINFNLDVHFGNTCFLSQHCSDCPLAMIVVLSVDLTFCDSFQKKISKSNTVQFNIYFFSFKCKLRF